MASSAIIFTAVFLFSATTIYGQRITTIQLDGIQYFISRMNPYSPELNYFLAYQYCRSLGLQLTSFETQEKADAITQYLRNAGYNQYDFWTSGNALGTRMLIWMSSGLPFNATFNYMRKPTNDLGEGNDSKDKTATISHGPTLTAVPIASPVTGRQRDDGSMVGGGCVAMKAPELDWDVEDCMEPKDFICEQTRCYYYNYGSIPVSTAQGNNRVRPASLTSERPGSTTQPTQNLLNNDTVNRRITLRPQESQPTTLPNLLTTLHHNVASTELPAYVEEEIDVNENIASRAFPAKDSATNVVYVTAISVDDGQKEESSAPTDNTSILAFEEESKGVTE